MRTTTTLTHWQAFTLYDNCGNALTWENAPDEYRDLMLEYRDGRGISDYWFVDTTADDWTGDGFDSAEAGPAEGEIDWAGVDED